jgi:hypothetical protein
MVPADFPHSAHTGALPGAAPIEGRYIVGPTPEEVESRYRGCVDLVEQLQKTALRFAAQNPTWTKAQLCDRLRKGISHEQHRWQLSVAEAHWVLLELARREGWDLSSRPDETL